MHFYDQKVQAQGDKVQTVRVVRQAAVNAVIAHSGHKNSAPVEFIAQHIKITVLARMQQFDLFFCALHQHPVAAF